MTLEQFFSVLSNANAVVTVKDANNELVKVYAGGYTQLVESLLAKIVESITVVNNASITVVVESEVSA